MLSRRTLLFTSPAVAMAQSSLRGFFEVAGPLPDHNPQAPLDVESLLEQDMPAYTRRKIRYRALPGNPVYAWLLIPKKANGKAALCLHQTTSIGKNEPAGMGGKPNLFYGQELAERGYLCLAPDYPSFGDDHSDFPKEVFGVGYVSGTMKGIVNHRRGVDLLLQEGARSVVAIGHSLGGHNAIFVSACDPRIKATVSSCGFTAMAKYYSGNLKGWSSPRYMPRISTEYGSDPKKLPWDFPDLLRAIAPRGLFVNAPLRDSNFDNSGVRDCVEAVRNQFPGKALEAVYPDCEHDFPPEVRQQAYAFLDRY